jgi:AraC-like DNA-binding protein
MVNFDLHAPGKRAQAMRVHFSTDDVPPRDRKQYWLDFVAKHVMRVTPDDRPDPATFRGRLDAQVRGRFTLYELQDSHRSGGRTAADISSDNSERFFRLRRVPCEENHTVSPSRRTPAEIRLGPGDFCVSSGGWPSHGRQKDGTSETGLLIPHGVLSPLVAGGRLSGPVVIPAGSPLGLLLAAAFDAANKQVPLLSPELGDAVLQNLCGLVALACGASEEGTFSGRHSLQAARLEAAKRHIDQHLAEPDLTPGSAAAALGISLRHLHLLFEPTGTSFAQYVMQRPLLQCRGALANPTGTIRSVADIAFGWGFSSLATFYRAFEREFGLPPTALRGAVAGHAD